MLQAVYAKNDAFVYREIAGEAILVPIHGQVVDEAAVLTLNEVGATIWGLIDGKRTLKEVQQLVLQEYEAEPEQVQADLEEFVQSLASVEALRPV